MLFMHGSYDVHKLTMYCSHFVHTLTKRRLVRLRTCSSAQSAETDNAPTIEKQTENAPPPLENTQRQT